MGDSNKTIINGKVYEHDYADITKSPVQESSTVPMLFWVLGPIVVMFVALYFLVPAVGDTVKAVEARVKAMLHGQPTRTGPPPVRGSNKEAVEYFTAEGKSFILPTAFSRELSVEVIFQDGVTGELGGVYRVEIKEEVADRLMIEYGNSKRLEQHIGVVVRLAVRQAASQVTVDDMREGAGKLGEALGEAISTMKLPEGVSYEIDLNYANIGRHR